MNPTIQLIVADPCKLLYRGVQLAYNHKPLFKPKHAYDGSRLHELLKETQKLCVLVTESFMRTHKDVISTIHEHNKNARVILLTSNHLTSYIKHLLKNGVTSIVDIGSKEAVIEQAILHANESKENFMCDVIKGAMIGDKNDLLLTKREWEVYHLVCKGCSNTELASQLFCSVNTVKEHKKSIMRKLNAAGFNSIREYAERNEIEFKPVERIKVKDATGKIKLTETTVKRVSKKRIKLDVTKEDVVNLYENNYEVSEVANHFMISEAQVIKYLKEEGLLTDR